MITYPAYIAANRFGMGARPGDLKKISADPKGWLDRQLSAPHMPGQLMALKSSAAIVTEFFQFQKIRKQAKKDNDPGKLKAVRKNFQNSFLAELHLRTVTAIGSDYPLQERLTRFWADHFTVSATKKNVRPLVGSFEREVIRPHILGKFEHLLIKAISHPAMLLYLDNFQSIGPTSPGGKRRKKGLNENLAREILELHTLGVQGGYVQNDVISLAKILTGWTLGLPQHKRGKLGEFRFMDRFHEPGKHQLLGKTYPDNGVKQGIAALKNLARHPSTARFIATKLVRHFISDNPPQETITILTREFLETGGHLGRVMKKLVSLPAVWQEQPGNIKNAEEFIISSLRGLDVTAFKSREIHMSYSELGQKVFEAPSPAGWPTEDHYWSGPDMILKRIEWAQAVAEKYPQKMSPQTVALNMLGAGLHINTRTSIQRADSGRQAITLLLASPEFQRR